MLAAKRLADVAPQMNLTEHVAHVPPPSANKITQSGDVKTGALVVPQKDSCFL